MKTILLAADAVLVQNDINLEKWQNSVIVKWQR